MTKKKPCIKQEPPSLENAATDTPVKPAIQAEPAAGADLGVRPKASFPIVGIGASAGGLAAFEAFFSGMPAETDPGMAFVLVQHLAPDHKSILSDLVKPVNFSQFTALMEALCCYWLLWNQRPC